MKQNDVQQGDLSIFSILKEETLRKLLNAFTTATNIGATFCCDEAWIKSDDYDRVCQFCSLLHSQPDGKNRCRSFIDYAGHQAARFGDTYITRCHAGLVGLFMPVMFHDIYLGCVACGPILMWEMDDLAHQEITQRIADLGLPAATLDESLKKLNICTGKSVQAAADLLFMAVNHLAAAGMNTLEHRKKMNAQQAHIAELVFDKKMAYETITALEHASIGKYPLQMEKELLGSVRLGDRTKARELLNEMLGEIFLYNAGDLNVVKARVLELVVVLSRAAVEGGGRLENMLGLNYELTSELYSIDTFEGVCMWITRTLDSMMDKVYETRNVKNAETMSRVMNYMRATYAQPLTLESVAKQVFLSPFYLSHLFSDELGITFIEYLTRIRMEQAKRLLSDQELSVQAVANQVGYDDASYFSKVFKKSTGLTPNAYRKNLT
ncbi:MAG: PocR ligand-binding domain-containing protein [Eubacteriales bacterium]|nr:PocR ligand-binding domain-containing protein [Eubacteriales bacterium]